MTRFQLTVLDTARVAAALTAIVVPARNEADRIAACLESLAAQDAPLRPAVYLCVNNTADETAEIARDVARSADLPLVVAEGHILVGGVGAARRIGHDLAGRCSPRVRTFLSTDADCAAHPAWVRTMEEGLRHAPAVLGRIEIGAEELAALPDRYHALARIEETYMDLAMEFERLLARHGTAKIGLNTAGGANLGMRADVYRRIGGFRPLPSGEDRDIVARIIGAGFEPSRLAEARVRASARAVGRAPGGMAERIAARLVDGDCLLDSVCEPFASMVARYVRSGPARADGPMTAAEAIRDIPRLRDCVRHLRALDRVADRHKYLAGILAASPGPVAEQSPGRVAAI